MFGANEAKAAGLVQKVLPAAELLPAAHALAREIVDNTAAVSIALLRQMMWRGLCLNDPMEAHEIDSRGMIARARSADAAEGVAAFLEKRPAKFTDQVSMRMPDYFPWWQERSYR